MEKYPKHLFVHKIVLLNSQNNRLLQLSCLTLYKESHIHTNTCIYISIHCIRHLYEQKEQGTQVNQWRFDPCTLYHIYLVSCHCPDVYIISKKKKVLTSDKIIHESNQVKEFLRKYLQITQA